MILFFMDRYLKSSEASKLLGTSSSSLWELKSTKVLEAGKHWIYVTGKPRSNVLFNIDKIRQWQIDMTKYIESPQWDIKEGKELATVKVYLNTGIIAGLIGVGFISSTLVFGVLLLVLK